MLDKAIDRSRYEHIGINGSVQISLLYIRLPSGKALRPSPCVSDKVIDTHTIPAIEKTEIDRERRRRRGDRGIARYGVGRCINPHTLLQPYDGKGNRADIDGNIPGGETVIHQLIRDPLCVEVAVRSTKKIEQMHAPPFVTSGNGRVMESNERSAPRY